jgi:hypothetical protein
MKLMTFASVWDFTLISFFFLLIWGPLESGAPGTWPLCPMVNPALARRYTQTNFSKKFVQIYLVMAQTFDLYAILYET